MCAAAGRLGRRRRADRAAGSAGGDRDLRRPAARSRLPEPPPQQAVARRSTSSRPTGAAAPAPGWRHADVLVENMRPPVKAAARVRLRRPCRASTPASSTRSISGFGQDGPYADRGGVDQIAQGMGGLMSVTGLPGTEPTRVGIPVVRPGRRAVPRRSASSSPSTSASAPGEGQWVQTSLLEAMIAMMDFQAARWTIDGEVPRQEGNHHPTIVPMGCFATADGHVNIAGAVGRLWRRASARPSACPTCPPIRGSTRHGPALGEPGGAQRASSPSGCGRARPQSGWSSSTRPAYRPGPCTRIDEVFADPQVRHLDMVGDCRAPGRSGGSG